MPRKPRDEEASQLDESAAQAYFHSIEEAFIALRGAPLLLSPEDWRVAREWFRQGIPGDLVCRVVREVFDRRRARGKKSRVNSLRYCAPAVTAAWEEVQALQAPGHRQEAQEVEIAPRLEALATALPGGIPRRQSWAERLRKISGRDESVEDALGALEEEILEACEAALTPEARGELQRAVEVTLSRLASRLGEEERERLSWQLWRRQLREHFGLPVLSLFSVFPDQEE